MKMNKPDLVKGIFKKLPHFKKSEIEEASDLIIDLISQTLLQKERLELRGFGCFTVRSRKARLARNPKTGSSIMVGSNFYSYFRPSKALREVINN